MWKRGVAAIIAAFLIVGNGLAQEATPSEQIVLEPITDETMGITAAIPEGWTAIGNGFYARGQGQRDVAGIALQTAPLAPDVVLGSVVTQFALTEAPEPIGNYSTASLDWTIYQVSLNVFTTTVEADLALASDDAVTYIVLLQAEAIDYPALHDALFLPLLDSVTPIEDELPPDVPYVIEAVTFDNPDAFVTLAGTLTLPEGDGAFPAVVLVTGSGPQTRDERIAGTTMEPFAILADALTRAGIAVLRYDDRGVGESNGDFVTATTFDLADDAGAAIDYLLTRPEINEDEIGILGHSEGGIIAAILGAENPDLDFIISMAGTGANGQEVLQLQNRLILEASGATEEQIQIQTDFYAQLYPLIEAGDYEAVEAAIRETTAAQLETLPLEERSELSDEEMTAFVEQSVDAFVRAYANPWFASVLEIDPAEYWAQTTVPVLALFGGKDLQVDEAQNRPPMDAALTEAGNEDVTFISFDEANHLFQDADTGAPQEYATLPPEFIDGFTDAIIEWLGERVTLVE